MEEKISEHKPIARENTQNNTQWKIGFLKKWIELQWPVGQYQAD